MGSPGPAWDAAPAAWEQRRTHNSCVLGKQSILLMLLLLPLPSLGTSARAAHGVALRCLHLLRSSASKSGPGYKAVKKSAHCSGLPQPTAGGEERGSGVPRAPITSAGSAALFGQWGRSIPGSSSSPRLHPSFPARRDSAPGAREAMRSWCLI